MLPFMVLAWAYVWGMPVTFLVCLRLSPKMRKDHATDKSSWEALHRALVTPLDD